ncbi:nucleoside monophosphate kinase [candidate division WWE3 bacterium]|nr:nucleoside monophosphate kinase [candidate division WWE3 bacterium]
MEFPIFASKTRPGKKFYDLNDPAGRHEYFHDKAGREIERLREYIDNNTFLAFLLAKKAAGKGTYSKMFAEIFGNDRVAHLSVGDLVRDVHKTIEDPKELESLVEYLKKHYRGFISVEDAMDAFLGRSQSTLIPTELILTMVRREIEKIGKKAIFLDGFPRNLDQISYSLYFREIMNLRDDRDFFVLIQVPEKVIDARMKSRVVCPLCNTSRNTKLLPTKFVKYDQESDSFLLMCDNSQCSGYGKEVLVRKEGDELGIEAIRDRIEADGELIRKASSLYGIAQIKVRNAIPVSVAHEMVEDYELTPGYEYELLDNGEVRTIEKPWAVEDDEGVESHSLLAAAAVLSFIVQTHDLLCGPVED